VRKVLVIDDDPFVARLVGSALERRNVEHSLDYCSDGAQGRLKASAGGYDLIVLDLAMPFMDGVTALEEMRRNPKSAGVPVVVVTALTDPALHEQARQLGAAAVITKPFEHWELADAVRLVLAGDDLRPPAT
jgi:DNA-binding response OmpR family regulator